MILTPGGGAARIGLALAIGLLVGFEREWSNKDAGIRTCALTALTGMLAALISTGFAIGVFFGVVALVVLINLRALRASGGVEITTSAALLLVYVAGAMIGRGDYFTPVAVVIVGTLLLSWKLELHHFAGELQPAEIRSALWLGLIAFVIYPVLPNRFVDRWGLVNPQAIWLAVIVVAAVGFVTYVLLRVWGTRGLYTSAVLGGAVSSAATVAELGTAIEELCRDDAKAAPALTGLSITITLLATVAMFGRNLVLLAIFSPAALRAAIVPVAMMTLIAGLMIWWRRAAPALSGHALRLASPLSLRLVAEFGLFFLAVQVATTLAQREWGHYGIYTVALLGGFLNSAGSVAAVGEMAAQHTLAPGTAGIASVIASMAAAVANAPIMNRVLRRHDIGWANEWLAWSLAGAGAVVLVVEAAWRP